MTQPGLFPRVSVPYRRTSRTSRQAAEALSRHPKQREAKRDRLLRAYVQAGARGLTDSEASAQTTLPRQSVCSLRASLITRGLVRDGYTTRLGLGVGEKAQTVYVATTYGLTVQGRER